MVTRKFKITGIKWDCDGENPQDLSLPTDAIISIQVQDADKSVSVDELDNEIADALSNTYGFCFFSIGSITEIKKYRVTCTQIYNAETEIEAESEEDAVNKVQEGIENVSFTFGESTADFADEIGFDNK